MSPVQPTEPEKPVEGEAAVAAEPTAPPSTPVDAPEAAAPATDADTTSTPAPTKVDAYKPRGIRDSKYTPLAVVDVVLRLLSAIFALIAFAVIAAESQTVNITDGLGFGVTVKFSFSDFFYFSYLLTANVIAFTYVLSTLVMACILLFSGRAFKNIYLLSGLFALDQIISYLLMSASTSAATGVRDEKKYIEFPDAYYSQAYASIAFSFLAFFALAALTIVSIHRLFRVARTL